MAELVFTSAPKEKPAEGRITQTFTLDGIEYTAVKPSQHQFVRLAASAARRYRDVDRAAAVLEFLDAAMDPESSEALTARMDDPEHPDGHIDFMDLLPVMEALVKLWGDDGDGGTGPKTRKR